MEVPELGIHAGVELVDEVALLELIVEATFFFVGGIQRGSSLGGREGGLELALVVLKIPNEDVNQEEDDLERRTRSMQRIKMMRMRMRIRTNMSSLRRLLPGKSWGALEGEGGSCWGEAGWDILRLTLRRELRGRKE